MSARESEAGGGATGRGAQLAGPRGGWTRRGEAKGGRAPAPGPPAWPVGGPPRSLCPALRAGAPAEGRRAARTRPGKQPGRPQPAPFSESQQNKAGTALRAGLAGVSLRARAAACPEPDRGWGRRGPQAVCSRTLGWVLRCKAPKSGGDPPGPKRLYPQTCSRGGWRLKGKAREPGGREAQPAQLGLDQRRSGC